MAIEPPRPDATPDALFARYRKTRDPAALGALFDAAAPGLFRLAVSLTPDAARAEDALQETFLFALEEADRWDPARPVVPWLMTVLRFKVKEGRRRDARTPDPLRLDRAPAPDDPAALAESAEERERLYEAMRRLPEPYRGVALLRWRYGHEPAEIADIRGEPPGTVWSILHRAVRRLKVEMGALPALLLAFRPERGLDGVRRALLRRAAAKAAATAAAGAGAAAGVATVTTMGGLLMANKALVAVAAVLLLGGAGWIGLRPAAVPPRVAPPVVVASNALAPKPVAAPPAPMPAGSPAQDEVLPPVDLSKCDRNVDLFGEVVDAEGKGIPGAAVSTLSRPGRKARLALGEAFWSPVRTPRTRTARDGTFSLRLRKGEETDLEVAKREFGTSILPFSQAGERVRVVLEKATTLEVVVRESSGKPVEGARLRLFGTGPILLLQATTVVREGTTGPDGRFAFGELPREAFALAAAHPMHGLAIGRREEAEAGGSTTLELAFEDGRSIEGRVTDAETGQPVPGATVGTTMLLPVVAVTDKEGRFLLGGWTERLGSKIRVEAAGYVTKRAPLPDTGPMSIAMEKGDRLVGRLVDDRGIPVPEAQVAAMSQDEERAGTCGPDGRFAVDSLRRDQSHVLIVLAPGRARTLLDFLPREGGPGTIDLGDLVIPAGSAVAGRVVNGDGAPLAGILVEIRGTNADRSRLLPEKAKPGPRSRGAWEGRRTDDLGRFRFPDQPAGKLVLTATAEGSPPVTLEVQTVSGKDLEGLELRLGAPSQGRPAGKESLVVRLASEEGAPVEGASVSARFGGEDGARGSTKADGSVRLENLPAGDLQVDVQDGRRTPRFLGVTQSVSLPLEGDLRIVVKTASSISGTVLGPDSKPLQGLLIQLLRAADGSSLGGVMSDEAGKFSVAAPMGEEVTVHASFFPPRKGDQVRGKLPGVRAPASGLVVNAAKAETNRTLTILLADVDGMGVEGATVYAEIAFGGRPTTARTDASGRARFEGLMDDEYRINFVAPHPSQPRNRAWEDTVTPVSRRVLPSGQEETFRFRKGIEIRGLAKMPDGTPASSGTAVYSAADGAMNWLPVDATGRFRLVVPAGVKLIEVAVETKGADGKRLRGSRKDWTPNEPCDIVLALEPQEER